jgi:hypothetical protein
MIRIVTIYTEPDPNPKLYISVLEEPFSAIGGSCLWGGRGRGRSLWGARLPSSRAASGSPATREYSDNLRRKDDLSIFRGGHNGVWGKFLTPFCPWILSTIFRVVNSVSAFRDFFWQGGTWEGVKGERPLCLGTIPAWRQFQCEPIIQVSVTENWMTTAT